MPWCWSMPASPLECTLTRNAPANPLDSALTKSLDLNLLGIKLLQKRGGGGTPLCFDLFSKEEVTHKRETTADASVTVAW